MNLAELQVAACFRCNTGSLTVEAVQQAYVKGAFYALEANGFPGNHSEPYAAVDRAFNLKPDKVDGGVIIQAFIDGAIFCGALNNV